MRRPRLNLQEPKDKLLFRLHYGLTMPEYFNAELDILANQIKIPTPLAKLAFEELSSESYCTMETDKTWTEHPMSGELVEYEQELVATTKLGIQELESWPDEHYEKIANNSGLSPEQIGDLYGDDQTNSVTNEEIPASDRTVSRTDNQDEWGNATAALDEVIAEFKEDHKFGNEFVREKNALIQTLEAGRELLNDEVIKVRMGVALILEPLKIVQTRVEEYLAEHPGVTDGLTVATITGALNAILKLLFGV